MVRRLFKLLAKTAEGEGGDGRWRGKELDGLQICNRIHVEEPGVALIKITNSKKENVSHKDNIHRLHLASSSGSFLKGCFSSIGVMSARNILSVFAVSLALAPDFPSFCLLPCPDPAKSVFLNTTFPSLFSAFCVSPGSSVHTCFHII